MTYAEEMRKEVVWPVRSPALTVDGDLQDSGLAVNHGGFQNPLRTQLRGIVRYSIWEPGFVKHESPHLFYLGLALGGRRHWEQETTF